MALPNDASIQEVAAALGVTDEEFAELSPRARRLTKGDLLALIGASTDEQAATAFVVTGGANTLPSPRRTRMVSELTIRDRATLGEAFGRVQGDLAANLPTRTGASIAEAIEIGDINCCCCPCTCCCAVSVAKPARIA
jgi:hypothetical protein